MPHLIDRRTGRILGTLSQAECEQLTALFAEPLADEAPTPFDPAILAQLAEMGASDRLLGVLQQLNEGREDVELGWIPEGTSPQAA